MRRARHFQVTGDLFDLIFTARPREDGALFKGITSDAPDDMHITGIAGYDPMGDMWTFVCESTTFDPLIEGEAPPVFTPTFATHYEGEAAA
jgi:hypothetical protein